MHIFADAHIGVNKRNKLLYLKSFRHFATIMVSTIKSGTVFNLGDLWDTVAPKPSEYNFVQDIIHRLGENICWYGIPGNHDMIQEDNSCAWDVILRSKKNVTAIKTPTEVIVGKHKVFVVPYFVGMLDAIKEYTGDAKILFSHFSTYQMNYFAGIVDETDPMFDKFDLIVTGDTHANYDNGKWHTCGSTYFCKVDEMVSPNCVPSILYFDENANDIASTFKRLTFPSFKPKIITSEEEAVDDDLIYVMISDNISSKPNIICKRLQEIDADDDSSSDMLVEHVGSVTFDSLIDVSYPNMSVENKNKLKMFCNRQMSVDELLDITKEKEFDVILTQAPLKIKEVVMESKSSIEDLL
jgi:hypothetical protein